MNPTVQTTPFQGGRFDSCTGMYSYLYYGEDLESAIAEALVRDLPIDNTPQILPVSSLVGKTMSEIVVHNDIELVMLQGRGLRAIGQDTWLTKCNRDGYQITRVWAESLLAWSTKSMGLAYRCRNDEDRMAYMLSERHGRDDIKIALFPTGSPTVVDQFELGSDEGMKRVNEILALYNATLEE